MPGITPIADVPDAPTIGTATDVGTSRAYNNGSATVTYTAAATGGAVTTFTATSTPGSFTATGASPLTVTGLQSATSYTFAVSAANSSGTLTSASTSAITATTIPQAPTIGAATAGNKTSSVAFTAGATGGKSISTYTVTSSSTASNTGASSPIVVTENVAGTYTYSVTATNANGTSLASSASNSLTFGVPAAPTIGTFTDGGTGTSGTLSFTLNGSNNSTITTVKYSTDGTNYTDAGTTSSPITITGLTPGSYTFYVKATNGYGDSSASGGVAGTVITPTSFESIATLTPNGVQTATFSSIPSTYRALQIRVTSVETGANFYSRLTFNGSSSGYAYHRLRNANTTIAADNGSSASLIDVTFYNRNVANATGVAIIDILDYASTSKNKVVKTVYGTGGNSSSYAEVALQSGLWVSTSAITSITIDNTLGNYAAGTTFALYGIN
jgi:trimeric autotransporter adhesin